MWGSIGQLIGQYGYGVVALLVCAENLGLPLPGETALITAAAFAAQGRLSLAGVIAASTIGTIAGGSGGYWIGRAGGLPFVHRVGRYIGLDEAQIERGRAFYARHGAKTVFLARFVAILRIVAGVLAGVVRMPFATFSIYNALGGLCWSIAIALLAYSFGYNLPRLHHLLGRGGLVAAGAVLLGIFLVIKIQRRSVKPST